MLKHRWFARMYGWPPDVVDDLDEDDDYWLPLIEEAMGRVADLKQPAPQGQGRPG